MMAVFIPASDAATARWMARVVLPAPPFWLTIEIVFMSCLREGRSSRGQTRSTPPPLLVWRFPVGSKNLCGFTLVVFEESPEPFTALDRACTCCGLANRRKEQHVALALMIPLMMIMLHVLLEGA